MRCKGITRELNEKEKERYFQQYTERKKRVKKFFKDLSVPWKAYRINRYIEIMDHISNYEGDNNGDL